MHRWRRPHVAAIVIAVLAVIGLYKQLLVSPALIIIGAAVLGGIYFLYKYGPARQRAPKQTNKMSSHANVRPMERGRPSKSAARPPSKRKSYPFQVIQGGSNSKDEEPPKYH